MIIQITGMTNNAGSIFMVFKSLIFKILKPELKIKSPPTIDNSQKNAVEIYLPINRLKIKIEPCHKNKTKPDHIIPIP